MEWSIRIATMPSLWNTLMAIPWQNDCNRAPCLSMKPSKWPFPSATPWRQPTQKGLFTGTSNQATSRSIQGMKSRCWILGSRLSSPTSTGFLWRQLRVTLQCSRTKPPPCLPKPPSSWAPCPTSAQNKHGGALWINEATSGALDVSFLKCSPAKAFSPARTPWKRFPIS